MSPSQPSDREPAVNIYDGRRAGRLVETRRTRPVPAETTVQPRRTRRVPGKATVTRRRRRRCTEL